VAEREQRGGVDGADLAALAQRGREVGARLGRARGREADRQPAGRVDPPAQDVGQRGRPLLAWVEPAHRGGQPAGLAGQDIPSELREAAALDGASGWRATRRITLPLLGPTIRIWLFLSVVGSLQVFDQVWIMTGGGPANASSTMVTYLVRHGFQSYEFGYGSAVAVIIFLICFVFALLYQRFVLRRDTRGALTRAVG